MYMQRTRGKGRLTELFLRDAGFHFIPLCNRLLFGSKLKLHIIRKYTIKQTLLTLYLSVKI